MKFKSLLTENFNRIFFSSISLQHYFEKYLKQRYSGKSFKFMDIKKDMEHNFINYLKQQITNDVLKPFFDKLGVALGRALHNDIVERKDGNYKVK